MVMKLTIKDLPATAPSPSTARPPLRAPPVTCNLAPTKTCANNIN